MRKIIQQGETLRLYTLYEDVDTQDPIDPVSLSCTVKKPDATTQVITYPSTDFQRVSAGSYFIRIAGSQAGTHSYKIVAPINASDIDVRKGKFDVESAT